MELRDYIEKGLSIKGSREALGTFLGMQPNHITNAKAHQRGLPNDACVKLARLVGAEPLAVIAASELATEKKPERREFWVSFMNPAKSARLAGIALLLAFVTNFVTPSPAEAAPALNSYAERLCIM